jgi:prefoldin subunit 5
VQALEHRKSKLRSHVARLNVELRGLQSQCDALQTQHAALVRQSTALGNQAADIERNQRAEDRAVLLRSTAKYLRDSLRIDSGTLSLHWDRLVFSGWSGNAQISLTSIENIEGVVSRLPSRAGIPLLERWFPGNEAEREALIVRRFGPGQARDLAVLAGLPVTKRWLSSVTDAIDALPARQESRVVMSSAAQQLSANRADLDAQTAEVASDLAQVMNQIAGLQQEVQGIDSELSLPDWEHKTVRLRGGNLQRQLDRELMSHSAAGWELVSTSSPRRDELIVALKRVRPV